MLNSPNPAATQQNPNQINQLGTQLMPDPLISALALVFVIEGILPFLSPPLWRKALLSVTLQKDTAIRIMGLCSMLFGLALLYWIRRSLGESL